MELGQLFSPFSISQGGRETNQCNIFTLGSCCTSIRSLQWRWGIFFHMEISPSSLLELQEKGFPSQPNYDQWESTMAFQSKRERWEKVAVLEQELPSCRILHVWSEGEVIARMQQLLQNHPNQEWLYANICC